ncbi:hypothetical protein J6590_044753 [Homalodisca vitripennis]|nr:hypothetical protein J6590_044753 [Homalodisca vitripennis]
MLQIQGAQACQPSSSIRRSNLQTVDIDQRQTNCVLGDLYRHSCGFPPSPPSASLSTITFITDAALVRALLRTLRSTWALFSGDRNAGRLSHNREHCHRGHKLTLYNVLLYAHDPHNSDVTSSRGLSREQAHLTYSFETTDRHRIMLLIHTSFSRHRLRPCGYRIL